MLRGVPLGTTSLNRERERSALNSDRGRNAPELTPQVFIAALCFGFIPFTHFSDIANFLLVVFGMLLWLLCIFALLYLGMREMSRNQSQRSKRKESSRKS
jgi:protein-S-isoprenylcysteine O-methyltransferase Ste14